jgi:16S rRNA pseudouridine516 synthase
VYEVTCKHAVSDEQIAHILKGVQLVDEDAPIAALACARINEHVIHMTLAEGKYHQVKRMVAAISNRVEYLKRIQIGEVKLPDDLAVGAWRWLTDAELASLNSAEKK